MRTLLSHNNRAYAEGSPHHDFLPKEATSESFYNLLPARGNETSESNQASKPGSELAEFRREGAEHTTGIIAL